jgi:hypothetical protein
MTTTTLAVKSVNISFQTLQLTLIATTMSKPTLYAHHLRIAQTHIKNGNDDAGASVHSNDGGADGIHRHILRTMSMVEQENITNVPFVIAVNPPIQPVHPPAGANHRSSDH